MSEPKKIGRPLKPINWQQVETMCKIQCTQEEIAAVCNVSIETLNVRCKDENGSTFLEFFKQKRQGGKASLRRTQWKMSETVPALAIWLGKQYLGQKDKHESEVNGSINVTYADVNEEDD